MTATATLAPPDLTGVTHSYVDVDGLKVHVAEAGSGPPIVLLHGWPQHWWCWRDVIPALAEQRRVICPDLRGMGWTDAPATGYEKHQLARDLVGLLDKLGLERVPLVGHDWGGWTTLLAGVAAPERFTELLVLGMPHLWLPPKLNLDSISRALLVVSYQTPMVIPRVGPAVIRAGYPRLLMRFGRTSGKYTSAEIDAFASVQRQPANARAASTLYRTFQLRELPKLLRGTYEPGRIDMPVRMIVGEKDALANAPLEEHGGHLPQLTVERLPGVGHFVPEESAPLVAERALALQTGDD
jgi:pimeloyl-ACP methyl ester carboxylesterase